MHSSTSNQSPPATPCRLLIDPPASGAWNMAVDEVLLEWSAETGRCAWRFYRWEEPTLSLGYFQPYENRRLHPSSLLCPVVRRLSGGGAILHDKELTYCLVMPRSHPLAKRRLMLYQAVHAALVEVLAERGIESSVLGSRPESNLPRQPFLCFQRRCAGDVVIGNVKIAGSAQRRSAGAVLQHGSILLDRSPCAPELASLKEAGGPAISETDLATGWLKKLAGKLSLAWIREPLTLTEQAKAAALAQSKYLADRWSKHRGRPPATPCHPRGLS